MKATARTSETEIKLAIRDAGAGRRMLRQAGFRLHKRRAFEANTVFDTPHFALRRAASLLRVREAGGVATLTFKGPATVSKHKSREELELEVSEAAMMAAIVGRLGYRPVFRYEKYRAEYKPAAGPGIAMVDETPIGTYLELEGSPGWIDRMAHKLGFAESDYITSSYGRLYIEWCERRGVAPRNMVFE